MLAAALVASAAIGAIEVLPRVEDSIARDTALTPAERLHAAGDRLGLDPAPFDAFRAKLRPRERYAVDVPAGSRGPFITRGEVVRAFVVPRPEIAAGPELAEAIRAFVGQRLAWYQAPRDIVFVEELPLTATGKIIRRELRGR